MKEIAIVSGKGGTGKTILSACFASLAENKVLADCDVDASNLHLILKPEIQERNQFIGGKKASLDVEKCTQCEECLDVCRFSAISQEESGEIILDSLSCEGCGVCAYVCPVEAITMKDNVSGEWFISDTKYGPLVHAKLGIGEENSGKLVAEVRKKAQEMGKKEKYDFILIDGPPGIGCPVIATLSGTHLALAVTEPTLSGIHDLERVCNTAGHFGIQTACCINKYDLNPQNTKKIESWCETSGIPIIGKIPFSPLITESMVQGIPFVEFSHKDASQEIRGIWDNIQKIIA